MYTFDQLTSMTNNELRNICRNKGITNYSKKPKAWLVDAIMSAVSNDSASSATASIPNVPPKGESSGVPENPPYVTCVHGTYRQDNVYMVGSQVSEVFASLKTRMNMPSTVKYHVNGTEVSGSYVCRPFDVVEFMRATGSKG